MTEPERRGKPVVLASYENDAADRCVDLFQRSDGSFGFEEYRRDPEDAGRWSRIGWFGDRVYATRDDALAAAKTAVVWFGMVAPKP
jgi:hypothetical protein